MFPGLANEIENLQVPVDTAALTELLGLHDRLYATIAETVASVDAAELWDLDAATSMTAWLRDHAGMTAGQAGRLVSVARRMASLPVTLAAWRDGTLTGGQIDAIIANLPVPYLDRFAETEATVVPTLTALSPSDTAVVLQRWRLYADGLDDQPEPAEPTRRLHLSGTLDGRGVLDGDLDPDTFALVRTALRVGESPDLDGEPRRTPAERRADALADVCKFFLDNQQTKLGGRHRPHLNAIINLDDWEGRYTDGGAITRDVIDRLLCDSALHHLLVSQRSAILDYGMATRTLTAALWAVLVARDEHCRFPGCDRPATWCDGHHVIWFSHGGPTRPDNLVLLCRRHHQRLHQPGWHAKLLPDGSFEVTDPNGTVRTSWPPGTLQPFP